MDRMYTLETCSPRKSLIRLVKGLWRGGFIFRKHVSEDAVNHLDTRPRYPKSSDDLRLGCGILAFAINNKAGKREVDNAVSLAKFGNQIGVDGLNVVGVNYINSRAVREFNFGAFGHSWLSIDSLDRNGSV